ncbi:hypothetical protein [Burkholderia sp. LMU1-1-1.1]|uniref:hypothetical protein n=1 Tax=Burkholderia sp. LMU1-1-1.1 TaxID=3135266 RepID=UPI00344A8267
MNPRETRSLPPATELQLEEFLRKSGSALSLTEALVAAVKLWIEREKANAQPLRGYQWKILFLPEGTRVRMQYEEDWHSAEVLGDELMYRGRPVSPHQLTQAVAGDVRNAWRDLWIRFPGEKNWACAAQLRARLQKRAATTPPTPAEAMAKAAQTMSNALNAALVLIEHVDLQCRNTLERRLPKSRREYDELEDIH